MMFSLRLSFLISNFYQSYHSYYNEKLRVDKLASLAPANNSFIWSVSSQISIYFHVSREIEFFVRVNQFSSTHFSAILISHLNKFDYNYTFIVTKAPSTRISRFHRKRYRFQRKRNDCRLHLVIVFISF